MARLAAARLGGPCSGGLASSTHPRKSHLLPLVDGSATDMRHPVAEKHAPAWWSAILRPHRQHRLHD